MKTRCSDIQLAGLNESHFIVLVNAIGTINTYYTVRMVSQPSKCREGSQLWVEIENSNIWELEHYLFYFLVVGSSV